MIETYYQVNSNQQSIQTKIKNGCCQIGMCCAVCSMIGIAAIAVGAIMWDRANHGSTANRAIGPILVCSGISLLSCSIGYVIGAIFGCCRPLSQEISEVSSRSLPETIEMI